MRSSSLLPAPGRAGDRARADRRGRGRSRPRRRRPPRAWRPGAGSAPADRHAAAMAMASSIGPVPKRALSAPRPTDGGQRPRRPPGPPGRAARRALARPHAARGEARRRRRGRRRAGRRRRAPATSGRARSNRSRACCGTSPAPRRPDRRARRRRRTGATPRKRRSGPVRWRQEVGTVGDDDDVAGVAVVEPVERGGDPLARRRPRRPPWPAAGRPRAGASGTSPMARRVVDDDDERASRPGRPTSASWTTSERVTAGEPPRPRWPGRRRGRGRRHRRVVEARGRGDDGGRRSGRTVAAPPSSGDRPSRRRPSRG